VAGGEFQMQPVPGEGPLVSGRGRGLAVLSAFVVGAGSTGEVVLIGNIGDGLTGVADSPGGVVEAGFGCGRIAGDADAPALVEQNRRPYAGGVKVNDGVWGASAAACRA